MTAAAEAAERDRRARYWAALDLDWDAMSGAERDLCAHAYHANAISPVDAEHVTAIVEQYRRDR